MKLILLRSCLGHDQKSPERGNVANVFEERSGFARSLLDKQHKNNPLECWKKSLKHLDKLLKHLDKALELLGKTLETPLAIR